MAFKEIFKDKNDYNEKSIVGFASFAVMVLFAVADLLTGYFGKDLVINEFIYNSRYSFEPVIGETYHLYEDKFGNYFLSLISPNEWNKIHVVSVRLNSEHKWVSIKE